MQYLMASSTPLYYNNADEAPDAVANWTSLKALVAQKRTLPQEPKEYFRGSFKALLNQSFK